MSLVSTVTNAIIKFHPTTASIVGGAIAGTAALEMFLRTFKDIADIYRAHNAGLDTYQYRLNLSKDLGGALFYGMLAANVVPYTAVIGGIIFTIYSFKKEGHTNYLTAKINWFVQDTAWKIVSETVKFVWNWIVTPLFEHVVTPLWTHVLYPVVDAIRHIVNVIFENIISPVLRTLGSIIGHVIPRDPIWYGVAAMGALIFGYYHYTQRALNVA